MKKNSPLRNNSPKRHSVNHRWQNSMDTLSNTGGFFWFCFNKAEKPCICKVTQWRSASVTQYFCSRIYSSFYSNAHHTKTAAANPSVPSTKTTTFSCVLLTHVYNSQNKFVLLSNLFTFFSNIITTKFQFAAEEFGINMQLVSKGRITFTTNDQFC